MSTQPIRDYLTKELLIEKNIVTYRSLSRVLTLNVNVAKNELAEFYCTDGQNLAATYLLSGQTQPNPLDDDVDMDPYGDDVSWDEDGEYVPQTEMLLVGERDLESAQASFVSLESIHVYSLSPSVIRDAGLLCTPTEAVRKLDSKNGAELAAAVGKVISAQVTVSTKPLPSWGGRKAPPPVAGPSKTTVVKKEDDAKPKEKEKEKAKPEKPKATGKLDFSKAKAKPVKKEEEKKKPEAKSKAPSRAPSVANTIGEKVQAKMEESKRGTKRKSALASDSEAEAVAKPAKPIAKATEIAQPKKEESKRGAKRKSALVSDSEDEVVAKPIPKAQSSARVRKGVILSDDDEDDKPRAAPRKGKGKAKMSLPNSDSEAEKDLRAMMDIDDDGITRASRDTPAEPVQEDEDEPMEVADAHMSDVDAKPAPVKRKPKKVWPVGRNGLKKKRIVKSKTRIDDKGYMVTDDFSEYESVDEEEEAEEAPKKSKAKPKAKEKDVPPPKTKPSAPKPAPAKAKPKPSGSSKGGQQTGIAGFFGKSKSK
ncbi:DNA polymerase subunit Cdc27 [Mycena crocata]|nr:DNA polymerase subunit Cdc27 [Mycena crocata]